MVVVVVVVVVVEYRLETVDIFEVTIAVHFKYVM